MKKEYVIGRPDGMALKDLWKVQYRFERSNSEVTKTIQEGQGNTFVVYDDLDHAESVLGKAPVFFASNQKPEC